LRHGDASATGCSVYMDYLTPGMAFTPELMDFRLGRALALRHGSCGSIEIIAQF